MESYESRLQLLPASSKILLYCEVNSDAGSDDLDSYFLDVSVGTSVNLKNSDRELILNFLQYIRGASVYSMLFEDANNLSKLERLSTRINFATSALALFSIGGDITLERSTKTKVGVFYSMKLRFPISDFNEYCHTASKSMLWPASTTAKPMKEVSHGESATQDGPRRASSVNKDDISISDAQARLSKQPHDFLTFCDTSSSELEAKCTRLIAGGAFLYIDENKKGNRKTMKLIAR